MAVGGDGSSQTLGNQEAGNNADLGTGEVQKDGTTVIPKSGEANKKDIVDPFKDLWEDPKEEGDISKKQTPDPSQQQQQQSQQRTPQEIFDEHITSQNFLKDIDLEKITSELTAGNTDSLKASFTNLARNVYTSALTNMNTVMDKKIEAGIKKAVEEAKGNIGEDFAVQSMQRKFPFTMKPAIAPIADQVLKQLIKKGKSVDEAIDGVNQYFRQTAQLYAKDLPPQSRPGSGRFSETPIPDNLIDTDEDVPDFMKILGGEEIEP